MTVSIEDKIKRLRPEVRGRLGEPASALIAQELTLRGLRRARKLTQARMATTLGISQDGVSRLEKRSDLLLSTLRKSIEAMGGRLSLVAEFPDQAPIRLTGIADIDSSLASKSKPHRTER